MHSPPIRPATPPSASSTSEPNRGRRTRFALPRFGLRAALLFGLLLCLLLALVGPRPYWPSREEQVLRSLRAVRARVVMKSEKSPRDGEPGEASFWRWQLRPGVRYQRIDLDATNQASDEEVAMLPHLKGVESVGLRGSTFTDAAMTDLARLPELEAIGLEDTNVTGAGLAELAASARVAQFYYISGPASDVDLLVSVDAFRELRSLTACVDGLSLTAAEAIGRLERLETLHLRVYSPLDPQVFDRLPRLRRLKSLTIESLDGGLQKENVLRLAKFPALERLTVTYADAGDAEIAELAKLPNLRALDCSAPRATNAAVEALAEVETLESLHLIRWKVDDQALEALRKLPNLRLLSVDESFSLAALERFQQERPGCQIFRQAGGSIKLLEAWLSPIQAN